GGGQGPDLRARGGIPELHVTLLAPRGQPATVGAESQAQDRVTRSSEPVDDVPGRRLPQEDLAERLRLNAALARRRTDPPDRPAPWATTRRNPPGRATGVS